MSNLAERLRRAALEGPDPANASARIDRFLAACGEHGGVEACVEDDQAARLLSLVTAQSAYLGALLIRDPPALTRLGRDPFLHREKGAAAQHAELSARLAASPAALEPTLRRYRDQEYLRLGVRELGLGAPEAVARELSHLADACLEVALKHLLADLIERYGEPRTADGRRCRFVVFGMGKLGGEELNFSSDIDLLYLYQTDAGVVAGSDLSLHQFFSRLCERLTRAISQVTDDGYCFRVDLRLRPEGQRGPLTNSLRAAEQYYESWGRPWERQAWLKARPVAGDLDLGHEALAVLEPFIWPRTTGPDVIEAVQALVARIRAELDDLGDLKLGPGGIRDVEFFVQALQMVHGRSRELRERGTLRALDKLLFAGLVSEREHRVLGEGYLFLRRLEHRLQLDQGRQTHALPEQPAGRLVLARRLGFAELAPLEAELARHRRGVAAIFATLGSPESAAAAPPRAVQLLLDPTAGAEELRPALGALGFADPDSALDELELLRRRPNSPFAPTAGSEAARAAPVLLAEIADSPDPDLALRRLVDLVARRGPAAAIWRLVASHRPLARLLASLFGTSEFLAKAFIAHPELLEPLLSAQQAERIRGPAELGGALAGALAGLPDEEAGLNALRRVHREEVLRIGLFDIAGELTPAEVSTQLSDLAEAILDAALALVAPATFAKYGTPSAPLVVLGLGKLGGRELSYSSDLDLVFVYGDEGTARGGRAVSHFEVMSRLAQRFIHALSAFLDDGRLYEVDTRLRPSGQKGTLVSSLAGFREYHARTAQLWERQALIKMRTVAGDRGLGAEIERLAEQHVYGASNDCAQMAEEIGRLRARMEKELARETPERFNVKSGRGGLLDVEFLVQYLQLREAAGRPRLRVRATAEALAALEQEGVLPADEAQQLAESYAFLRRFENRLRIVHDRPIDAFGEQSLDKLARRMGYRGAAGTELMADYREHSGRVRAIYARYLPVPSRRT